SGESSWPTSEAAAWIVSISVASSTVLRYGRSSPFLYALRNRSSHGSAPIARAMRSICISVANDASVTPKPRNALAGCRFVYTQCTSIDTFGIVYGPQTFAACLVAPYGECREYAPASCQVVTSRE